MPAERAARGLRVELEWPSTGERSVERYEPECYADGGVEDWATFYAATLRYVDADAKARGARVASVRRFR